MTNHHKIAVAINNVAKTDADQLTVYINLGMAISSLILVEPGVESERAAVRAVMKMQEGELAAQITTTLAESTLRLACLLFREEDFIEDIGATTIKGARAAITKRNNAGKPKKEPKPKIEPTPEVEEMRDAVGKLESHLNAARVRADKAESELFEVVAERDRLRAQLAKEGDIEALMAERDALAARVAQLQQLVAGIASAPEPEQKPEPKKPRSVRRPPDVDPENAAHCRRFLRAWTMSEWPKLAKKRDAYIVTSANGDVIATSRSPWGAVALACAEIPHCEDAVSYTSMLPDGLQIVTSNTGAASVVKDGEVIGAYPSARRAFEAVATLDFA